MAEKTRHQCMIYEGPSSAHLPRLVPLLLKKLEDQHRCIVLGNPMMVARMHADLTAAGLNVGDEVRRGALVLSSNQDQLEDGVFDSNRMLTMLKDAVYQALVDGYHGLWATGDMTWEFGSEKNLPKLLEYECGLEKLFRTLPALSGICQYHKDTLPLDMIGNALYTHQAVYINHTLQRVNPYYLQPESLQYRKPPRATHDDIERMLVAANPYN